MHKVVTLICRYEKSLGVATHKISHLAMIHCQILF